MTEQELMDRVVDAVRAAGPEGLSRDEVADAAGVSAQSRALRGALKEATRTGQIVRAGQERWARMSDVEGTFCGLLALDGDAFVVEDGDGTVIRILSDGLGEAIVGDEVEVEITEADRHGQPLGVVKRLISERREILAGRVRVVRGIPLIELEGVDELAWVPTRWGASLSNRERRDFEVWGRGAPPRGLKGFPTRALIVRPALPASAPTPAPDRAAAGSTSEGRAPVTSRMAFSRIRRGEMHASRLLDQLTEGMNLPIGFTQEILAEVAALSDPEELQDGDLDLRPIPLVTIDGADAKDFDDAVFAEEIGGEIHLMVAVADVSHYVAEDSELDQEAERRGCSVYLPGRVYPMLPPRISDDLCSLRPHVPRRCAWISILIRRSGEISAYDAGFGLMRSWARLTYEQVEGFLDGEPLDVPEEVSASIEVLEQARNILFARRKARGLMDLDLPEPRIALTPDGSGIAQIEAAPRLRAHRLIEECMLLANETMADLLASRGWPAIYRTHAQADSSKLEPALELLRSWGIPVESRKQPSIDELSDILEKLVGDPSGRIFSFLVLRSLAKAIYSTEDAGHFGIGADRYVHFTSPIRRYPDLWVHRMLRRCLAAERKPTKAVHARWTTRLDAAAKASNEGEKIATSAERYAQRILRARLMLDRIGDTFEGVVSDVFPFGAFVTIQEPYVDGLIPIRKLGRGWWLHDEKDMSLVAEGSSERVRIGDRVTVRCVDVDMTQARVNLERISSRPPERIFERLGATPAKRRRAPPRARAAEGAQASKMASGAAKSGGGGRKRSSKSRG